MKKIILALSMTISASAFAENASVIFPRVYNYGTSVQVDFWNHTDRSVNCSGFVYLTLQSGARLSEYYFDYISPGMHSFRSYRTRDFNDRISMVSHSIFCR